MDDPDLPQSLEAVEDWIMKELSKGSKDPKSDFHWPTLGTVGTDGAPRMRTVVLRDHEPEERRLVMTTDARARKVEELKKNPRAALHVWTNKKGVQLRLHGEAEVLSEGPLWDDFWNRTKQKGTTDYSHRPDPGTKIEAHDAWEEEGADPRENFRVVKFTYREAVYLCQDRHGKDWRADLVFENEGKRAEKSWIVP